MTAEPVATFDLELYVPGVTGDGVVRVVGRLRRLTAEVSSPARELQLLGATFVPADEVCFVRFRGSRTALELLAQCAELPDVRVSEVVVIEGNADDS